MRRVSPELRLRVRLPESVGLRSSVRALLARLPFLKPTLSVMRVMLLLVYGTAESMLMVSAAEAGDVLAAVLVAVAVMAWEPSFREADAGTVKLQLPKSSVVMLPREVVPAKSSTELLASAVPVKVGVVSLVRLSEEEYPMSEAAVRSGVEGAAGRVSSRSLMASETACSEELPATSEATTMKE